MAMPSRTTSCGVWWPIGWPSNITISGLVGSAPATARKNVVLPAPLAPMMATVSPCSTLTLISNSAWKSP